MADLHIVDLVASAALIGGELFVIDAGGAQYVKATSQQIMDWINNNPLAPVAKTASDTLILSDIGKMKEYTSTSPTNLTCTIPPHSSVPLPAGAFINIARMGTGGLSVLFGAGVTLLAPRGSVIAIQYGAATLQQTAVIDTWVVRGDTQ